MSANDLLLATMGGRTEANRGDYSGELFEESQKENAAAAGGGGYPAFGYKKVWLMHETEVTLAPNEDMGGMNVAMLALENEASKYAYKTIVIKYNGVDYSFVYNGQPIGNVGALEGEDSGEPFIAQFEGATAIVISLRGDTVATVGVYVPLAETIPDEYIPPIETIDFVDLGAPVFEFGTVFSFTSDADTVFKIRRCLAKGGFKLRVAVKGAFKNAAAFASGFSLITNRITFTGDTCELYILPGGITPLSTGVFERNYYGFAMAGSVIICFYCNPNTAIINMSAHELYADVATP